MKDLSLLQQEELHSKITEFLRSNVRVFINYRCTSARSAKMNAEDLAYMSPATKEIRSLPLSFHRQTDRENFTELKRFIREEVYQNENSKLSELMSELFSELPKGNKFNFVVQKVSNLARNNATEAFYDMIKVSEYMLHYRALYKLANQMTEVQTEVTFSMGSWQSLQEEDSRPIEDAAVLEAAGLVLEVLSNGKEQIRKRIYYNDITRLLVRLRNKYIGHGTLTYSISEELLNSAVVLAGKVYEIFLQDGYELTKACYITKADAFGEIPVQEDQIPCCHLEEPLELLYNASIVDGAAKYEYIDYITGNITTITGQGVQL
jgi:hypothetical protein